MKLIVEKSSWSGRSIGYEPKVEIKEYDDLNALLHNEQVFEESFEQFSKYYFDPKLKMYEEISAQKVCEIWKHTLDQLKTNGQIKLLEEK